MRGADAVQESLFTVAKLEGIEAKGIKKRYKDARRSDASGIIRV